MARKSRKNVGIIGLGIIGSRVAAALRAKGQHAFVWSRTPRAEPNFMGSPAKVAEVCDVIQIFVSDADAVFEIIDRLRGSLKERHILVCSATIGPEATREAARRVTEMGAKFVDAPFTGSKDAAAASQLVYFLGGDDAVLDLVEPVLAMSSKAIVRIGDIGQAAAVKIATNMLVAVTVQTIAEALALVGKSGVPLAAFAAALENHGVRSGVSDMKLSKILAGDFEPHFSLKHMFKDVQLAIHMANEADIDIPATTATAAVMYGGLNRGWGPRDFSVMSEIYADVIRPPVPAPPETPEVVAPEPVVEAVTSDAPAVEGSDIVTPEVAPEPLPEPVSASETPVENVEPVVAPEVTIAPEESEAKLENQESGDESKQGEGKAVKLAEPEAPLGIKLPSLFKALFGPKR